LRGHEIDDCDLYAESFGPVMGEHRIQYHNLDLKRAPIAAYADRLLRRRRWFLSIRFGTRDFPRS
jgi:NAD(P)H dehydrogenase (quinone)